MPSDLPSHCPIPADAIASPPVLPAIQRYTVFTLLAALTLFSMATLIPNADSSRGAMLLWIYAFTGVGYAQVCLLAAWGALANQAATVRIPRSVGFLLLFTLLFQWSMHRGVQTEAAPIACVALLLFVLTGASLLVIRRLFHWRLELAGEGGDAVRIRQSRFTLRQALAWTAATAAILALARCDPPRWTEIPQQSFLTWLVLPAVVLAASTLPLVIAGLGFVLGRFRRKWFGIAMAVLAVASVSLLLWLSLRSPRPSSWLQVAVQPTLQQAGFLLVFLAVLWIARSCGYRMVRRCSQGEPAATPTEVAEPSRAEPVRKPVWQTPFPYVAIALVLTGLALSWPAAVMEMSRRAAQERFRIIQPWREVGLDGNVADGKITRLYYHVFPPTPLSEAALRKLSEPEIAKTLTTLHLLNTGLTDEQVRYLRGLTHLTTLWLQGASITDNGFAQLSQLRNLEHLSLWGTKITDASMQQLGNFPRLKSLDLGGTGISDPGLAALEDLHSLEFLNLEATQISDAGLAHLEGLENLRTLRLGGTKITDEGLKVLTGLHQLCVLSLDGTQITDAGLAHLQHLGNLEFLDLSRTVVTDQGLAQCKSWPHLTMIFLRGTAVTDAGVPHLLGLTRLAMVDLTYTSVTPRAVDRLRQAHPQCAISYAPQPPSAPSAPAGR